MTGMTPLAAAAPTAADLLGPMPGAGPSGKIEDTARQFEAVFLSMLLKQMRESLEPDGLFAGDAGDVHGGLFDFYLGKHLADAGGVGFAAAIVNQLAPTTNAKPTPAASR
jgi:Rod binding domain-containing protein